MTTEYLEQVIKDCKTDKQVKAALNKAGIKFYDDPYSEMNGKHYMSLWIDKVFRIYRNIARKEYRVQKWHKVEMKYSGVPVFFGNLESWF